MISLKCEVTILSLNSDYRLEAGRPVRRFCEGGGWYGEADRFDIYLEVDSTGLAKGLILGKALRQRGAARITPWCLF